MYPFRNTASFLGEDFLASRPSPKLQDHLLSAVLHSLFNIFAATLHIGARRGVVVRALRYNPAGRGFDSR